VTEKKSGFVGRSAAVASGDEAAAAVAHLLATDRRVAAATHNIRAWRVRTTRRKRAGVVEEEEEEEEGEEDDGEKAAGGRLLRLLQAMRVWNVVVVVTRWYGGTKLGPDRFRIINAVAKEALVQGGFVGLAGEGGRGRGGEEGMVVEEEEEEEEEMGGRNKKKNKKKIKKR
jgi:putative IMPACT (imprinted ancient) family translation regulator